MRVEFLKEHFRLPWISSFIFCKLSEQDKAQASDFLRVSLVSINETSMPKNSLPIHQFPPKNQTQKLAVCVKPFHFQFNRALWLIEFIEMYRIQGAEHFIFYNHTLGPDVEKAIKYYIKLGIVSLLNWNLPLRSQKDIRTEAMFTAINDCNLRAVNRFEMVAMVDIDEFIMPQKAPNLTALLQPHLSKKFGSFNFRNVFHYLYWENNTDTLTKFYAKNTSLPYLLTQMKLRRVVVSQNHGTRSKYIVRPNFVTNAGNHQVWKYVKGESTNCLSDTWILTTLIIEGSGTNICEILNSTKSQVSYIFTSLVAEGHLSKIVTNSTEQLLEGVGSSRTNVYSQNSSFSKQSAACVLMIINCPICLKKRSLAWPKKV